MGMGVGVGTCKSAAVMTLFYMFSGNFLFSSNNEFLRSLIHCFIFYGSFYYFESSLLNILRAMILKFVLWLCRNGGRYGYDRMYISRSDDWNMRNKSLLGELNRFR